MDWAAIGWGAANGAAFVLLIAVLGGWARVRPDVRPQAIAGAVCAAAVVLLLLALFASHQVPAGWVTVLHEGRSMRNVRQLYGLTVHAGAGFHIVADWLTGHDVTTLSAVVRLNVCLAVINTLVFFFLASHVLRSWWGGLAFALGYAANQNTLHAAVSELPAMLWTTYFWLGCIGAAVVGDQTNASARLRRLALCWLAVLALLAMLLRPEFLVIGGPAVVVAAANELGWEAAAHRAVRAAGRLVWSILAGRLSILLLVTAALLALEYIPWLGSLSYALAGLAPLNFSFLLLPQKLGVFLPFGFIALFILGVIYTVSRWFAFCLLPITFLTLFKMYANASQGVFESFRYFTFLTPVVFFLALFGVRQLAQWAERWAWPWWWRRLAVLLIALSMMAWQPLGPRESFGRRHQLPGLASAEPLLGANQQTEVRYLLDLVARYPTCVFLVKAARAEATSTGPVGYRWGVFGASVRQFREMPEEDGERVEQAAGRLAPGAACVLFYRSLDCNLVDHDGCQAEIDGRVAIEERVLANLPYNDISSYGAHRPEIRLGVYPVVPARR